MSPMNEELNTRLGATTLLPQLAAMMSSIRTALLTTDATTSGEVVEPLIDDGDFSCKKAGCVRGLLVVVVAGNFRSRDVGVLMELKQGVRVAAKVTGGSTVNSLGLLPRLRIVELTGELSRLVFAELVVNLKVLLLDLNG